MSFFWDENELCLEEEKGLRPLSRTRTKDLHDSSAARKQEGRALSLYSAAHMEAAANDTSEENSPYRDPRGESWQDLQGA